MKNPEFLMSANKTLNYFSIFYFPNEFVRVNPESTRFLPYTVLDIIFLKGK